MGLAAVVALASAVYGPAQREGKRQPAITTTVGIYGPAPRNTFGSTSISPAIVGFGWRGLLTMDTGDVAPIAWAQAELIGPPTCWYAGLFQQNPSIISAAISDASIQTIWSRCLSWRMFAERLGFAAAVSMDTSTLSTEFSSDAKTALSSGDVEHVPAPTTTGGVPRARSGTDWAALLAQWSDWSVSTMLRIIDCESHGDANAVSPGGQNWGAFQINVVHGYSVEQMTDPVTSTAIAHDIYLSQGYRAWSCY